MATACTQGKRTKHGKPRGVVSDDQPDAREGRAGRPGVAERFVVPLKPGNAGGGKGPQFKTNALRGEGPGDWATYQLRRVFRNCRRRYTRKRRQKPAIASTPCTTRSAARMMPLQQGRVGGGWPGLCGHRRAWGAAVAWRTGACSQARDLPTRPHQKSVHPQGQRQTQASGYLDLAGSGLHDSSDAGAGTDLRSRPSTRTARRGGPLGVCPRREGSPAGFRRAWILCMVTDPGGGAEFWLADPFSQAR